MKRFLLRKKNNPPPLRKDLDATLALRASGGRLSAGGRAASWTTSTRGLLLSGVSRTTSRPQLCTKNYWGVTTYPRHASASGEEQARIGTWCWLLLPPCAERRWRRPYLRSASNSIGDRWTEERGEHVKCNATKRPLPAPPGRGDGQVSIRFLLATDSQASLVCTLGRERAMLPARDAGAWTRNGAGRREGETTGACMAVAAAAATVVAQMVTA